MQTIASYGAWFFLASATAVVGWLVLKHRHQLRQERALLFKECLALLTDAQEIQEGINYPRIRASTVLGGRACQLSMWAMADTLQTRRLPPLWLVVDVQIELCIAGTLDVLVRPTGVEVFSPSRDLEYRHELPIDWPQSSILKSSFAEVSAVLQKVDKPINTLLQDPYTKCITVRPRGLRYIVQIAQSSQAHYMVLRNTHFGPLELPAVLLQSKLESLGHIVDFLKPV